MAQLPAPPPGALGWNVYTGSVDGQFTWREFVPAPGLDEKLEVMADELVAEIEKDAQP